MLTGESAVENVQNIRRAAVALFAAGCIFSNHAFGADPPPFAAAVGYTVNTFSVDFTSSTVDISNSGKEGFSWYLWNLFGYHTKTSEIVLHADHSVTISEDPDSHYCELMTATPANNAAKFMGTAFGGGAFIEAEFKFNPADVAFVGSKGWPSFWSMPLENSIWRTALWPGQAPNYFHSVEADFFEYDVWSFKPANVYGGAMHDWYGIYGVTCPRTFCQASAAGAFVTTPVGTDFTQYHKFGYLWVPATETTPGYVQYYFDGMPSTDKVTWSLYQDQPPPPDTAPWKFGVLDKHHLILIIGTGVHEPITVAHVNVWQTSSANNLQQPMPPPTSPNAPTQQSGFVALRVYPNPWRSDLHSGHLLTFDQLPPNSTLKIFTLSGGWVKTISNVSGKTTWDLKNNDGVMIAPGIYLYKATNDQNQKAKGKFTVIR